MRSSGLEATGVCVCEALEPGLLLSGSVDAFSEGFELGPVDQVTLGDPRQVGPVGAQAVRNPTEDSGFSYWVREEEIPLQWVPGQIGLRLEEGVAPEAIDTDLDGEVDFFDYDALVRDLGISLLGD